MTIPTSRATCGSRSANSKRAGGTSPLMLMSYRPYSWRSVKVVITLANGKNHDLLMDVSDANEWVRRFGATGTSALGDWVEVMPEKGAGRTFVRSSEVVTVQLIDDGEDNPRAVPQP